MPENNQILSVEGQLVGMPLAGPESFSAEQLAYLKRALGVDETVLYTGTFTHQTFPDITLSESYANFEKLEITLGGGHDNSYPRPFYTFTCYTSDLTNEGYLGFTTFSYATSDASSVYPHYVRYSVSSSDTTKLSHNAQGMYKQTCASTPGMSSGRYNTGTAYEYGITRVVGIHRIAGGNQ